MELLTADSLGADVSQLCDLDVCIDIPLKGDCNCPDPNDTQPISRG